MQRGYFLFRVFFHVNVRSCPPLKFVLILFSSLLFYSCRWHIYIRYLFKFFSSALDCSEQVQDEENDSPMVGKHKKGCHCKKTRCLKKYCECFQAKILCSENCKCVDCKNFEVCDERLAVLHGDHSNMSTCIQQDNPAIAVTINLLGNRFSPALGKRKGHELPDSNKKGSQIQRLTPHQEVS